jgi:photosystem II stability/assembly factor-like uncharacterized protein
VGDGGAALFFDGGGWNPLALPTTSNLNAVFALAANDVWVAGDNGVILHYDGNDWTPPSITPTDRFFSVWASGDDDVYVSGNNTTLLHYDGTKWKDLGPDLNSPFPFLYIHEVWGLGRDHVYAAAELTPSSPSPRPTAGRVLHGGGWLYRYDGQSWSEFYSDPAQDIWSVWGSAVDNVWVTGDFGSILRYDGAEWTTVWYPNQNSTSLLESSWGSAPDNLFLAGSGGTILHYSR